MFVPHVFVQGEARPQQPVVVEGDDAHHLVRVLRLGPGDAVVVVTPAGERWFGRLVEASPSRAAVLPETRLPSSEPPLDITLAQGLPKGAKMDEVIRHGTEVGIREFVPLLACRSVSRPDERAAAERL
ncbi:MAG TPA: RsmE family RNA methyltransferase, partial [Thermaerobacter sp.]